MQNNPIRYIDPTGHKLEIADGIADYYCTDPKHCKDGDSKVDPYILRNKSGKPDSSNDILDPTQNDNVTLPIPTMDNNLQADDSGNNFWAVASAFGDIAFGGFVASLSFYALVASCVYAGPVCIITAPIFLTTAVVGAQVAYNGIQSLRKMNDDSIEPTGREIIDRAFPFLKKKR